MRAKGEKCQCCSSKCLFFTAVWLFRLSVRFRHANETIFSSGLAGVRYRIGGLELPAHKPLSDFIIEKKYWSNSGQNRKSIRSLVLLRTLTKRKSLLIIIIYSLWAWVRSIRTLWLVRKAGRSVQDLYWKPLPTVACRYPSSFTRKTFGQCLLSDVSLARNPN